MVNSTFVNYEVTSFSLVFSLATSLVWNEVSPRHLLSYTLCVLLTKNSPFKITVVVGRLRLKCDGTRAETTFRLSAKWTSPFKPAGALVQSTTGSRGVRYRGSNGSNAGYTMFRGSIRQFPLHFPSLRHRVPSHFNWTVQPILT